MAGLRGLWSGFTLVEVLVATLLAAVVAGGTMMAYVTAARMAGGPATSASAEAAGYAQQTLEKFRNLVAANDPTYTTWLSTNAGPAWHGDAIVGGGGSDSIQNMGAGARRCFRVTPEDCDGVGGVGDCHAVQVRVCWNDVSACSC